jgi:hypothetical protein
VTDTFELSNFKPLPVVFKTVPSGYVYRAPNAWLFGGTSRHYLVNETQKAEILATFKTPTLRTLWIAVVSWIVISALVAEGAALWLWVQLHSSAWTGLSAIVTFPFLLYVGALFYRQILLRRLHPILARLPAANDQISNKHENEAIAIALSATSISPTKRRILKICSLVGVSLFFGVMIVPTIETYQLGGVSMLAAFMHANAPFTGLLSLFAIVGLVGALAIACGYERAPNGKSGARSPDVNGYFPQK